MSIVEIILCLQAGKCFFNFLPFLCQREVHNQSSIISLLILLVTDTMITGFLLCLWIGGWIVSPSTEVIFLRFLGFQNEAYKTIPLLLPWISFSEEWTRSHIKRQGGQATAESTLSMQSRLLSLTCWLIAASYSQHPFLSLHYSSPACEAWDWRCPFTYIHEDKTFDWLLPSIGLALGSILFCSTKESRTSTARAILGKCPPLKKLGTASLLVIGTAVSFILLPPFMALSSWSILALDRLCKLLSLQTPEPLITVQTAVEQLQMKKHTNHLYRHCEYNTDNTKTLI